MSTKRFSSSFLSFVALTGILAAFSGCGDDTSTGDAVCGNATVETGEQCDDGNKLSGDGCSASCQNETPESCGDGTVDAGEECDDGNTTAGDGCSATCTTETAGVCGDGTVNTGETCDDGNTTDLDGCSATCQIEPVCGDSTVDVGEDCDDGNTTSGDGCSALCRDEVVTTVCQTLPALPNGETCAVTAGDGARLITGDVLSPTDILQGGQVLVDANGAILYVGCDGATDAACDAACKATLATATKITCPTGVISPALINTHDHITFTQNSPYNDTGERYEHRHEWRKGYNGHTQIPAAGSASADAVRWGELRFLFGGATSTVGSGGQTGILRNLDRTTQEGLNQTPVNFDTFPLGDSTPPNTQLNPPACSAFSGIVAEADIGSDDAYLPHVAEGINAYAENEFVCLSNANPGHDVVQDKSAFIHSIGLSAADYSNMAASATALIWSPRSNITLYGDTAVVTEAARLGVLIALGTDWIPTGSMNVLRELHCADSLNATYYDSFFSDRDLWLMVTANAAAATATEDVIGSLTPGRLGDITIFNGATNADYRAVIDAGPSDVVLVMRGGKVLYGDKTIVSAVPNVGACEDVDDAADVCGVQKRVCVSGEIGKTYQSLRTAVNGIYGTFFCGTPTNEPSCTPTRPASVAGSTVYTGATSATDNDGDGIANAMDNCPDVFNPVRPMDGGAQADADDDAVGDACDPCPLDANTMSCTVFDPNDADSDGIPNASDNCPAIANPQQQDADMDGKGDACDLCPNASNPGTAACPVTIYDIKDGTVPVGSNVAITNAIVTGRANTGFFMQVKQGDPGYAGADFSGIFVFAQGNTVKVGDRVSVTNATVQSYAPAGCNVPQVQLSGATVVVNASLNEALPAPVDVPNPATVATGGADVAKLEGVAIKLANVDVTSITPPAGPSDVAPTNEFVVEGSLRVNDYLYLITPFPSVGTNYASLSGVLEIRNCNSKLELRGTSDVVGGSAGLTAFGPQPAFVYEGDMGVATVPTPLTVSIGNAVATDTFVAISSASPSSLAVVGGGVTIPAGQTSAPVLLDALNQSPSVTLTATLGMTMQTASVRVVGTAEVPVVASITPPTATITPGGTQTFTVSLDFPPETPTDVALSLSPVNAGAVPATLAVAAGQLSATFDYIDGSAVSSATVSATLGGTVNASISVVATIGGLMLNELDYDSVGTDTSEYVEIYYGGSSPLNLAGYQLVLYNGASSACASYRTVDLGAAGTINPGQYLVVGSNAALSGVATGALTLSFGASTDYVQNGAPDGAALLNATTNTVVDKLSYEGAVANCDIFGVSTSLVEMTVLPTMVQDSNTAVGSLCRIPNGTDTDVAATDWKFSSTPTPGAANVP
jgi:cysteine-rich repeat protein